MAQFTNQTSTSEYTHLGLRIPRCFVCKEKMEDKKAYMVCENMKHFCHKKCLKTKVAKVWEDKLNSGHSNYSGGCSYKKYKCSCGKKMEIQNTVWYKFKKGLKYASPLLLVLLI